MGYTHYWRRPLEIEPAKYTRIVEDFARLILPLADNGVMLGDSDGAGVPLIEAELIAFNGLSACGHPKNSAVSIPWPSSGGGGVGSSQTAIDGRWFAGASLDTRCCNGDCSYESVVFERIMDRQSWQDDEGTGLYFNCCKTAFRPYDIALTALLIIAKKHLGAGIRVTSDGEDQHWFDAKMLCQTVLGYGIEFELREDGLINTARPDLPADFTPPKPAVKPVDNRPVRYLSAAETAKLVRVALKEKWPAVKFSVKSKTYSGGASISVRWFDGPDADSVRAITGHLEGSDFDGMQDLKTYRPAVELNGERVRFGADYVFAQRDISYERMLEVADRVCYEVGAPMVAVKKWEDTGSGYIERGNDLMVNKRFLVYHGDKNPASLDEAIEKHFYGDSEQHSLAEIIRDMAYSINYSSAVTHA